MYRKLLLLTALFTVIQCIAGYSQSQTVYKWWDPAKNNFPVIEGQGWPKEIEDPYDRLPARAEKNLRAAVWDLSHNAAGLLIRFKATTTEIIIRYKVSSGLAMSHMPSTGVSGVDLY